MDIPTLIMQAGGGIGTLLVFLYGLYKVADKFVDKVGVPMVGRVSAHLDRREARDEQMGKTLETISENQIRHMDICRNETRPGLASSG